MHTYGIYASGSLILTEAQISGLERCRNMAMYSHKTVGTLKDEGENEVKVRTAHALAVGVCQIFVTHYCKGIYYT
ncbi:MAG: hypothetical protein AAE985_05710 [Thermoplasmataceae archaeon]